MKSWSNIYSYVSEAASNLGMRFENLMVAAIAAPKADSTYSKFFNNVHFRFYRMNADYWFLRIPICCWTNIKILLLHFNYDSNYRKLIYTDIYVFSLNIPRFKTKFEAVLEKELIYFFLVVGDIDFPSPALTSRIPHCSRHIPCICRYSWCW